jgi:polyhydroxyalkanoate synthase
MASKSTTPSAKAGTTPRRRAAPAARSDGSGTKAKTSPAKRSPAKASPVATSHAAPKAARSSAPGDAKPASFDPAKAAQTLSSAALALAQESAQLYGEWARTLFGLSSREVPQKDPRFADAAWRDNPLYRRLGQSYLAFCDAIDRLADRTPEWRDRERARFLGGVLTSTLAPTNTLVGNPAALKRAMETGGASLVEGVRHMADDLVNNQGMPRQVNEAAFKIGENLAATPGSVVFRNEMVEVLQYKPTTAQVAERPTLAITPPIGKYYFLDLSPKRSFVDYALSRGIPFFITSWRNPTAEQGHWGLDDYVQTLLDVVDAVCEISGSDSINTLGMCAGGILTSLMLAVMAQRGDKRVNATAFNVMLLDFDTETAIGGLRAKPLLAMSRRRSQKKGILPASSLATVFTWMRPNDLVWNYWVNNYLMGKEPPAFDILAWSVDNTNLPAKLHGQFLDVFEDNTLTKPGELKVLGEPIDLGKVGIDIFATGGLTDHLTPWKACYESIQLFGGRKTFILSNAGHIASLVNPPGNPKATYWIGPEPKGETADAWREKATQKTGTWWEVFAEWALPRSGAMKPAPAALGSKRHKVLGAAPGRYVLDKS